MHGDFGLISLMAVGLGLALLMGFLVTKLRLPPLVGYVLAGVLIGPHTPGITANVGIAQQLSELGVMLLMFGVGLHFSLKDLLAVRRIVLPGAVAQITLTSLCGFLLSRWWGWPVGQAVVFGLALSVASTVVVLRALEARDQLDSVNGRIVIGWLVVEDLVMVLVLVLLPPLAGLLGGKPLGPATDQSVGVLVLQTLGKVALFMALTMVLGRRILPRLLLWVARTGSRELFTLSVIVAAITFAYASSHLFGVSYALGAFFAGVVLSESEFSQRAAEESLPLRDAFAVLFFVAVGMLFDPHILLDHPLQVLAVLAVIVLGKALWSFVLVLLLRYPLSTALTVGASLAQIGEFSFILMALGKSLKLLHTDAQDLVLAGSILAIALNSLMFGLMEPLQRWLVARSTVARLFAQRSDPLAQLPMSVDEHFLKDQVVLVGYGGLGQYVAEQLRLQGIRYVVVDGQREIVEKLRQQEVAAVLGEATDAGTLIQAHIHKDSGLIVAVPDTVDVVKMTEIAQTLNPGIQVVIYSNSVDEAELFRDDPNIEVLLGKRSLALQMAQTVIDRQAAQRAALSKDPAAV